MIGKVDPAALWLGAFVGAQVLLVFLCVIKANAYRERAYLLHAAATLMAVIAVQALLAPHALVPAAVLLLVPAMAGLQLLDLMSHAGGLRQARRWLLGTSAIALPALAVASFFNVWAMAVGLVLWLAIASLVLWPAWRQSRPWVWWVLPGLAALAAASLHVAADLQPFTMEDAIWVSGLLAVWSACTYLATGWRGRIYRETRARVLARNTTDPLTGLATPLVLAERVQAARHLTRRYGHPSVLMVVNIDNLGALGEEFGPEVAESAVLVAANRVREALLRDGDVAARLAHARIGILAEGVGTAQAAATVAGRILVAGLKDPLPEAKSEFLHFRIVMTGVPTTDMTPRQLLQRLNARLDQEVQSSSERRIVTLTQEELLA
ncbi:GGDEF domain-containing protein [Ramlibacter pallidus]|uniref:GGDEF domain-containing protein n=1 Tax=Ramlibacter pallidus TaxID=2780087 RepID=A0ABR9S5I0_9BURK|nr:GGDEF domain-containing protein [Ramlibacter pallidus]MBE7368772.1 GGDEF domain-containing protein [Ramlibacter pallidus]